MAATASRILVPVDFSEPSRAALDYAVDFAPKLGASLVLLHVVGDPITWDAWNPDVYTGDRQALIDALVADARTRLEDIAAARHGVAIDVQVAVGVASQGIVDTAAEQQCNLIIIGTHGRTGVAHALIGSVAERVVRTARCPVLTVRPEREHPEVKSEPVLVSSVPS